MAVTPLTVDVLCFSGCPHDADAIALVEDVAAELGVGVDVRRVEVADPEDAERQRFLGSPTVRVNGRDVEPGADERAGFSMSCRIFRTRGGSQGVPDRWWVVEGLLSAVEHPDERTRIVLQAAAIPDTRTGSSRGAGLTAAERRVYASLLASMARGEAAHPGADPTTMARLAEHDLVHTDDAGSIAVAYPFSGRPRRHVVRVDGGPPVHAMCAIDALGVASMVGAPVTIESSDPVSGDAIHVAVTADGEPSWEPATAVVLAAHTRTDGPSYRSCCDVLNFFVSEGSARDYLATHPDVAGFPVSIPDAARAGGAVFGHAITGGW